MDRFDPRWADDRDSDRSADRDWGGRSGRDAEHAPDHEARSPFARHLDLPHGDARERVQSRRRDYDLDGADVDALATIGAFRVVQEADLRDGVEAGHTGARISRLQEAGLLDRIPLDGPGRDVVVLTERGRDLLDGHRLPCDDARSQTFYAGLKKPRELSHDAQVYAAFRRAEARIRDQGGRVRRVVLDYELKRDYQRFLQAQNRGRSDSDGTPMRDAEAIAEWARAHQLPYHDDHVNLPDVRLECEDRDGRLVIEDLEIVTPHYRGAHAAAKARSGFTRYRAAGARVSGAGGSGRGGRGRDARLAEELL